MQSVISKTVCKWVLQEIRDHDIGLLVSVPEQAAQFVAGPCDTGPQLTQNPPHSKCHAVFWVAFK